MFFLSHYDINRPLHSIFDKVLSRTSKRVSIDNAEIRKRSKVEVDTLKASEDIALKSRNCTETFV